MSNGDIPQWNCAAGICCRTMEDRTAALTANLMHHLCGKHPHFTDKDCQQISAVVLEQFDQAFPNFGRFARDCARLANGGDFLDKA